MIEVKTYKTIGERMTSLSPKQSIPSSNRSTIKPTQQQQQPSQQPSGVNSNQYFNQQNYSNNNLSSQYQQHQQHQQQQQQPQYYPQHYRHNQLPQHQQQQHHQHQQSQAQNGNSKWDSSYYGLLSPPFDDSALPALPAHITDPILAASRHSSHSNSVSPIENPHPNYQKFNSSEASYQILAPSQHSPILKDYVFPSSQHRISTLTTPTTSPQFNPNIALPSINTGGIHSESLERIRSSTSSATSTGGETFSNRTSISTIGTSNDLPRHSMTSGSGRDTTEDDYPVQTYSPGPQMLHSNYNNDWDRDYPTNHSSSISGPSGQSKLRRDSTRDNIDETPAIEDEGVEAVEETREGSASGKTYETPAPIEVTETLPNDNVADSTGELPTVLNQGSSIKRGNSMDIDYGDNEYETERLEGPCKPFVSKLAYLLKNGNLFGDVIRWDDAGTTFIMAPSDKMINVVLPDIFFHKSVAAFTRQLNTYNFSHLTSTQLASLFSYSPDSTTPIKELSAWSHPYFTRDDQSMLSRLHPRPSRARLAHSLEKQKMILGGGKLKGSAADAARSKKSTLSGDEASGSVEKVSKKKASKKEKALKDDE